MDSWRGQFMLEKEWQVCCQSPKQPDDISIEGKPDCDLNLSCLNCILRIGEMLCRVWPIQVFQGRYRYFWINFNICILKFDNFHAKKITSLSWFPPFLSENNLSTILTQHIDDGTLKLSKPRKLILKLLCVLVCNCVKLSHYNQIRLRASHRQLVKHR